MIIIFLRINWPNFVHFISDVVLETRVLVSRRLEDKTGSLDLSLGSSSLGLGLEHVVLVSRRLKLEPMKLLIGCLGTNCTVNPDRCALLTCCHGTKWNVSWSLLLTLNSYCNKLRSNETYFFTCVTKLIQMIIKYELRFVAFTLPNLCSWVVIFVSGICRLKKTLKHTYKPLKKI